MPTKNASNEITITRIYDAPVKAVWEAWTDDQQVGKWWGPRGFTLTTHSKDLKVGGMWHYTMHGPDGADYVNKTIYLEVEKYKKLVYDHGGNEEHKPLFRVTATFADLKGKTQLTMTMSLPTAEAATQTKEFIKKAGGNATWDRLAEHLEKAKDIFIINRAFETSQEQMFSMWTDPKHFSQWLAPAGFSMKFQKVDIKEGGEGTYSMTNGVLTMYGRVNYKEILRPDRLVYTQQFLDENGNISRHPALKTWPETMLTTVTFASEGPDQTRVTVQWEPFGQATSEEKAAFIKMRGSMTQGWTGSFDKLDDLLKGPSAKV